VLTSRRVRIPAGTLLAIGAFFAMRARFSRLFLRHLGVVLGAIALASGCVAGTDADGTGPPHMREAGPPSRPPFSNFDARSPDGGGGVDGGLLINSLCGTADYCLDQGIPDNPMACAQYDAGGHGPGLQPDGGAGRRDASQRDTHDSGDASSDGAIADAGGGARDASGNGRNAADSSPALLELPVPAPAPATYACQVGRDNSDRPVHQCVPSGSGKEGSPCTTVNDCAPGLGCVGSERSEPVDSSTAETGRCFQYCCDPSKVCDSGTYCAERRLLDGTTKKPLVVPVCAPGESCGLLEPYPCEGLACSCPPSTSCTVVGGDGTKGCVRPGTGKVGDSCPCAAGYYCALATATCWKMCKTDGIDDRCTPGRCQAAAGFPPGFGLCVGYVPSKQ
jgi:hypothetical protein